MPGNELVQSLVRGLDLLRLLAESDRGLRLPDIVVASGLKRATVYNLLKTLASREFVTKDGPLYRIGPAMYMLIAEDASNLYLQRAEAAVHFLAQQLPEATVSFGEPVDGEVVVRFRQSPERILMERNSGAVLAPYQTASGLAFLAYTDSETRQRVQMRHPFAVSGLGIWGNEERLEDFLAQIRSKGYALPPFSARSRFKVAAVPHLAEDGKLSGILGAA